MSTLPTRSDSEIVEAAGSTSLAEGTPLAHSDASAGGFESPRRFAYADPPYPGQSWRLYGDHPDYAGEVNHAELVARLVDEFPDGWALSTSASALHEVLPLCPAPTPSKKNKGRYLQGTGTRILVWTKPQAPWRPVGIQYGWEPVLLYGGRPREPRDTLRDWVSCIPGPTDVPGAKPRAFCDWLFNALGAQPGDELVDLFPGSGAVGRAWDAWTAQGRLAVA